jgi:WD40 repeat protein
LVRKLQHPAAVHSICFSRTGERVVTGASDKKIRVWNTASGELESEWQSHEGAVL